MRKNRLLAAVCAAAMAMTAFAGNAFPAEDIASGAAEDAAVVQEELIQNEASADEVSADETAEEAATLPEEAALSEEEPDAQTDLSEAEGLVEQEEEEGTAEEDGLIIDTENVEEISEAEEAAFDGTCGQQLLWRVTDAVLIITGEGDMDDYSLTNPAPWNEKAEEITGVVVEEGVSGIGTMAFNGMENVIVVELPSTLIAAREGAFRDMSALEKISVSLDNPTFSVVDGVLYTAEGTELVCYPQGLTAQVYQVPAGVTAIDAYAFYGQDSLETLLLPETIGMIGDNAFAECSVLTEITFG